MRDPVKAEGMGSSSWLSLSLERMTLWDSETNRMDVGINRMTCAAGCFPGGARGKEPACQCRRHKRPGFNPMEEGRAAHSGILAWRLPRTEETGGLQSTGSQRVGHA